MFLNHVTIFVNLLNRLIGTMLGGADRAGGGGRLVAQVVLVD